MTDLPDENRRLSEEEVAFIIKKASEFQEREQIREVEEGPGTSLTLHEVEQIVREADIDPRLVRRAARELAGRPPDPAPQSAIDRLAPLVGSPTRITFERSADGEISNDSYAWLAAELRRTFEEDGRSSSLGHTFDWATTTSGSNRPARTRHIKASFIAHDGLTTIHLQENLRPPAAELFIGLIVSGGGGMIAVTSVDWLLPVSSVSLGVSLLAASAGGFYMLARRIFGRVSSKRRRQLEDLMGRLEIIISRRANPAAPASPGEQSTRTL